MNIARTQKRIDQIVTAATQCIVENGYDNLTMQRISEYSGLSRGAINHYFKTKQDILVAVLNALDKQLFNMVDTEVRKASQVEDHMRLRISLTLSAAKEDPVFIYLTTDFLALAMNNSVHGEGIRKFLRKYRHLSSLGLKPGFTNGKYRKVDPESIGAIVMAAILGIGIQWILDKGSFNYDDVAKTAEDMIMFYLQKKE